jgi:four helix bundle protein
MQIPVRWRLGGILPVRIGMKRIQNYRDLIAWQRSMDLAVLVYRLTEDFHPRERYGLASQTRDAAVSIPSNIAEGHRQRTRAYVKPLVIAMGSHGEFDTQSELSFRLNFIVGQERTELTVLTDEVGRLTNGLLQSMGPRF